MKTRKLGKNGSVVSTRGLGCMGMSEFHGPSDEAETLATIHRACQPESDILSKGCGPSIDRTELRRGNTNMQFKPIPTLAALLLTPLAALHAAMPDFQSQYLAVGLSRSAPAFSVFAVDSLGQGKLDQNPVLAETNAVPGLELEGGFTYKLNGKPVWCVRCGERTLTLRSDYATGVQAPPFVLAFDQKANHATLLGLMKPGERQMNLPCVLHLPDMGSLRITGKGKLDYDARRFVRPAYVRIAFPPATAQRRRLRVPARSDGDLPEAAGPARFRRYPNCPGRWGLRWARAAPGRGNSRRTCRPGGHPRIENRRAESPCSARSGCSRGPAACSRPPGAARPGPDATRR